MDGLVRAFSLRLLRRLQKRTVSDAKLGQTEEGMEDGQLPQEEMLQTMYLPEEVTLPADKTQVLPHVELMFALSVRVPDLLDEWGFSIPDKSVRQLIGCVGSLPLMDRWMSVCRRQFRISSRHSYVPWDQHTANY